MLFNKQQFRKNNHKNRRLTQSNLFVFINTNKVDNSESAVIISYFTKSIIQRQILLFIWFLSDPASGTRICSLLRNIATRACIYTNKPNKKRGIQL